MKVIRCASILLIILSFISVMMLATAETPSPLGSNIIRIRSDGSVEGTDRIQRNGDVYTLVEDITSTVGSEEAFIFIERDNIVFDGGGHTIQGLGRGTAICMLRKHSVTIKNFNIEGFETGINFWNVWNWPADSKYWDLPHASNNQILDNNITVVGTVFASSNMEAGWAIYLVEAENNSIRGNTITSQDPKGGIFFNFETTKENSIIDNTFVNCGLYIKNSNHTIGHGNTVDGKPLVLLDGASNQVIDDAGLVYLFSCQNMTINNIEYTVDYGQTIQLMETTNTQITNCKGYITLIDSHNNSIHDNYPKRIELSGSNYNKVFTNIINKSGVCITLYQSSNYNEIYNNTLLDSSISADVQSLHNSGQNAVGIQLGGVQLGGCQYNSIYSNTLANHGVGIECSISSQNDIYDNKISDSGVGISLGDSDNNKVFENDITKCSIAVDIRGSHNLFYHNNFIENTYQVSISHQTLFSSDIITKYSTNNTFDLGYPAGGNYWSDYNSTDLNSDGIGDTPYVINANNTDRYPLMNRFSVQEFKEDEKQLDTPLSTIIFAASVATTFVVSAGLIVYFRKRRH